jgi:hypothetical protein
MKPDASWVKALVDDIRVDVEQYGLNQKGNPKLRAVVRVRYCFQEPGTGAATVVPVPVSTAAGGRVRQ